jgi:hypothetical protein
MLGWAGWAPSRVWLHEMDAPLCVPSPLAVGGLNEAMSSFKCATFPTLRLRYGSRQLELQPEPEEGPALGLEPRAGRRPPDTVFGQSAQIRPLIRALGQTPCPRPIGGVAARQP